MHDSDQHIRIERRLPMRLMTYWKRLHTERGLPEIRKFNPHAIEDVWPHCIKLLITEVNEKRTYKYEFMGKHIIEAFGKDMTGLQVSPNIRNVPGTGIIKRLDAAIPLREPVMEQGQFINDKDKLIKYRSCILPFGSNKYDITHVVLGLSWREF